MSCNRACSTASCYGPVLSAQELERCLQTLAALRPAPEYVVLSGSFPPGTDGLLR